MVKEIQRTDVSVEGGKYVFTWVACGDATGKLFSTDFYISRYGERWFTIDGAGKAILAAVFELDDARRKLAETETKLVETETKLATANAVRDQLAFDLSGANSKLRKIDELLKSVGK